jgi:thiamine pyrophosphokinase
MGILKMISLPRFSDDVPLVILAAGDYPSGAVTTHILKSAGKVVCCDGAAAEYVACGGRPYAIVGDCDSLPEELRGELPGIVHYSPDQETNDLTKAVKFCVSQGLGNIVILGATGKREDHTMANISLMAEYIIMPGVESVRMVTERMILDAVAPDVYADYGKIEALYERSGLFPELELQEFEFGCVPGQQVSIFTPVPGVRISTRRLVYPLENARLRGWWSGTLNETISDSFSIAVTGPAVICRVF